MNLVWDIKLYLLSLLLLTTQGYLQAQEVSSFTLINASTDQDIKPLEDGDVINLAILGTQQLNIRANTNPSVVGSVNFSLDAKASFRIESVAPYALAGDQQGDYYNWTPSLGQHTVTATPYSGASATGTAGQALSITFSVINQAGTVPNAPSQLQAQATAYNQVNLTWKDNANNENQFVVETAPSTDGPFTQLVSLPANTSSYTHNGLQESQKIVYRVKTQNQYGASAYSNLYQVQTPLKPVDPTPDPEPQPNVQTVVGLTLVNANTNQDIGPLTNGMVINLNEVGSALSVRATTNPQPVGSVTFNWNEGTQIQTENILPYALAGDTQGDYVSWTPTLGNNKITVSPYTERWAGGEAGQALTVQFTVIDQAAGTIPASPSQLLAQASSSSQIEITWQDNSSNEAQFVLESAPATSGPFSVLATLPANTTSYSHTGLSAGQKVVYRVKAQNQFGASAYSNLYQVQTPLQVPAPPTNLQASEITENSLLLSWTGSDFGDEYIVQLSTQVNTGYNTVQTVNWGINQAQINGLAAGTDYYFQVLTRSQQQNSVPSSAIKATTLNPPPPPPTTIAVASLTLMNADTDQEIGSLTEGMVINFAEIGTRNLSVRANTNPSNVGSVQFNLNGANIQIENVSPYTIAGDEAGNPLPWTPALGENTLTVTPFTQMWAGGQSGEALTVSFTVIDEAQGTPPAGPSNLNAQADSPNQVSIAWQDNADNETQYILETASSTGGPFTVLATLGANTQAYTHTGLNPEQSLAYRVKARNQFGDSPYTSVLQIQTPSLPPPPPPPTEKQSVVSFTLINADTDQEIGPLTEGMEINISEIGTRNLNVRANTDPATVGSVKFAYNGDPNYKTENVAPYTLGGDNNGNYLPWTPSLGNQILKATPYPEANIQGEAGTPLEISFRIIEDEINTGGPDPDPPAPGTPPVVSGELRKWHKITISFTGPNTSEDASFNPFLNYRLDVTFKNGNKEYVVPGYYAADGNAGATSAKSGSIWKVHFAPDEVGTWSFKASFRKGNNVAVNDNPLAGQASDLDGQGGSFQIAPSNKGGKDFRAKGKLKYVNEHFMKFSETGEYFLKGGADSPENFLAYRDFDGTYNHGGPDFTKTYDPHKNDWKAGDPTWKNGKGKGMIGALNYLSSKGMNSVYFITMNVNGDGKDVWPWTSHTERYRYDVSKLDQWEIVFSHMDKLGIMLHVLTQETENDQLLDGAALGTQRKLYYRELIARFGHHLAITWNLGEENDIHSELPDPNGTNLKAYATYISNLDPYGHYICVHTYPGQYDQVYNPLLGYKDFDGTSLQLGNMNGTHNQTIKWLDRSSQNGHKWVVNLDEIGPASTGVKPDADDFWHNDVREKALWGNLMAGGGGVEWYFGYQFPHSDLTCQDWRSRDHMWELTDIALKFFRTYLPFWEMSHQDALTSDSDDYCFAKPGEIYAIYLPNGGSTNLNFGPYTGDYTVLWYNPRTGKTVQDDNIKVSNSNSSVKIGNPPSEIDQDWVALIRKDQFVLQNLYASAEYAVAEESVVYPNPASHHVNFKVDMPYQGSAKITIQGLKGVAMYREFSNLPAGEQTITLEINDIPDGVYTFKLEYPGTTIEDQLIIQH